MRLKWLFALGLVIFGASSYSQIIGGTDEANAKYPVTRVGQVFTVTLRPGAKQIQVHVVGNEVASARMSDTNLTALLKIGSREWQLSPKKEKGVFIVDTPSEFTASTAAQLKLNINNQKKTEDFDFKLNTTKP
jgi:hypothetical protein